MKKCRTLTKTQVVSRELPLVVVWELWWVDVHIVVSVDCFNNFPLNVIFGFLTWKKAKRKINCMFLQVNSWGCAQMTVRGRASQESDVPSYLHEFAEQHYKDEAENACYWYRSNQQRSEQIVGNSYFYRTEMMNTKIKLDDKSNDKACQGVCHWFDMFTL